MKENPYIEESVSLTNNEQRIIMIHEQINVQLKHAKDSLLRNDDGNFRKATLRVLDTIATLDMHLNYKTNRAFSSEIHMWYRFWTLLLLELREKKDLEVLKRLGDSVADFTAALKKGVDRRLIKKAREDNESNIKKDQKFSYHT